MKAAVIISDSSSPSLSAVFNTWYPIILFNVKYRAKRERKLNWAALKNLTMFVQVCTRRIQYFHKLLLLITGMICDVTIVPYKPAHTPNSGVRACLHEGGGPQIGEVTRLGGVRK